MQRIATRPLSASATQAANRELFRRHPGLFADGKGRQLSASGAEDATLRSEWMDIYVQSGGGAEPTASAPAAAIKAAVAANFSPGPAGSSVSQCPFSPSLQKPVLLLPPPPRNLPTQSASQPPCELLSAVVTCEHGRQAGLERVLMVVARDKIENYSKSERVLGVITGGKEVFDTITANLAMKGGCGSHPNWIHGPIPSGLGKSASVQFKTTGKASLLEVSPHNWKTISPMITRLSATACAGVSGDCDIRAYPPGTASMAGEAGFSYKFYPRGAEDKWEGNFAISCGYERENVSADKFKVDFLKFTQKFSNAIGEKLVGNLFSDDDNGGLYPTYPRPDVGGAPKKPQSEGKIAVRLSVSGEWEWKEETGGWKAYCQSTYKILASPLVEVSGEFPVYGPPIPPKLKRWVDLGLYAGASGKVTLGAERVSSYWPHNGSDVAAKWEATGEGELEFSLFAKLLLVSEDFLSGSVGGKTGFKVSGAKAASGAPQIEFKREWTGLKATLSGEAAWGLFSYEREFVLFERYECKDPWIWTLT